MQTTSATWDALAAADAPARHRLKISGTAHGEDELVMVRTDIRLFDSPAVGRCISRSIDIEIMTPSSPIGPMAQLNLETQLYSRSTSSEWLPKGTFFIDTRPTTENGTMTIKGYDAMLKMEQKLPLSGTWPKTPTAMMTEIATAIGVTLDSRTALDNTRMVELPSSGTTMREVAGWIAGMHGGNWVIAETGKLLLVPLMGFGGTATNLGKSMGDLDHAPAFAAWSGVRMFYEDTDLAFAGTETGRVLEIECPWATQAIASAILTDIQGEIYRPFEATDVLISPAMEIGDPVTVDGVSSVICTCRTIFDALYTADISAPEDEEVDHEYHYQTSTERKLLRKVGIGVPYYGITISREQGLTISRSDGNSEAVFNSNTFAMRAKIDGVMKNRIYFDPIRGDYVFDGALGADAIFTESLYAETGDVSELTVDRLSTSRRIRKYILSDTSDDNYIHIQDQYIQLVTGTPEEDENNPGEYLTEQATNRYGAALYWEREPDSHTVDGYPLDEDGVQIYTTTGQTSWPVMIYSYVDHIKAQWAFELNATTGYYEPRLTMGEGDQSGYNKGWLYKGANVLELIFKALGGKELGIRGSYAENNAAGYLDLYGLRQTANIDFSHWDDGYFTETPDGTGTANRYVVTFDAESRPVSIADAAGHVCTVTWEAGE